MRKDNLTFEAAILAPNLELFGVYFNDLKIRIFPFHQFYSFRQLFSRRHSSRGKDDELWRVVCNNIEKLSSGSWISTLTKGRGLIDKENSIFPIDFTSIHCVLSACDFSLHDFLLLRSINVVVKHFKGAMQIRDDQINNFFIFATPTVNYPWVIVPFIPDWRLHSSKSELLLFVVAVATNLNSHWTNQARV